MDFQTFAARVKTGLFLAERPQEQTPAWVLFNLYLGYWMRCQSNKDKRFMAFLVLATREYSAVFSALGSVIAGAYNHSEILLWPQFASLGSTDIVYWPSKTSQTGYSGIVSGVVELDRQEFIEVQIQSAPRRAEVGTKLQISRDYFQRYRFSLQKPRSETKKRITNEAWNIFDKLIDPVSESWLATDDSEVLVVTKVEHFSTQAREVKFSVEGRQIELIDLLSVERNRDRKRSKTKLEPPKGDISGRFPLVILDGITPYYVQEHIDQRSNLLLILDRSEFDEGVLTDIKELSTAYRAYCPGPVIELLNSLPCGAELAIFELDSSV